MVSECRTWQSTGPLFNQVLIYVLCKQESESEPGTHRDVRYSEYTGTEPLQPLLTKGGTIKYKGCYRKVAYKWGGLRAGISYISE